MLGRDAFAEWQGFEQTDWVQPHSHGSD